MRLRQLVLACGLASLLASPLVNALGLGEVKLNSTLNQPLNAEIRLLDTRDLNAEQILVSLASPADFERNGVDRLYFYTEFQFKVDLENPSGPVVRVTSRNPVREPYLNFLVEARWTAGRLLREYTLLMDLPTYDDQKTVGPISVPRAEPDVPVTRQSTQGRVSRPTQDSVPTTNRPRRNTREVAKEGEYQIKPNDTLWEIALAVRPDRSVSVHQAMVALYEANPEAFINGDISRLKEGKVLRIPDTAQMTASSKSEAANQFVQLESGMGAQLSTSTRSSNESSTSSEISGRVTLEASSARNTTAGQGSGADDGRGRALESELASTLEELDRVKSENTELTSRVQDLEAQIETMEKMLALSDENMRALQLSAEQTNQSADVSDEEPSTTTEEEASSAEAVSSAASSVAAVSSVAKQEAKKLEQAKPKVVPRPAPEPTLTDKIIANAPWIGIGLALLGGLIAFVVYRRRRQAQLEQEQLDADMMSDDSEPLNFDASFDDQEAYDEVEEEAPQDNFDLDADLDDDVNPADKADIYIAYGQLDKAEQLLLRGLERDPNSTDIRMKLLEVYSQQQDAERFDKQYAALIPIAAPALLARASELRSHIPDAGDFDVPDFTPDLADEPAAETRQESLDDLELDLDDELISSEPETRSEDDFSFELDLTDDADAPDTSIRESGDDLELSGGLGEELDLDFDLDDISSVQSDEALDLNFDLDDNDSVKSDETLDLDFDLESQADDIQDINLALDDLEEETLPEDLSPVSLDGEEEPSLVSTQTSLADLDLADDDFNLDLDADSVDLAALDNEMSSLDEDFSFDEEETTESELDLDADLDSDFSLEDDNLELDESQLDDDDDLETFDLDETENDTADDLDLIEEEPLEESLNEDALFEKALSDIDDQDLPLSDLSEDKDDLDSDDLDFLAEADEAATKLDLARAYIDMGDMTGARDILSEVVQEGTDEQRKEAKDLLSRIDS